LLRFEWWKLLYQLRPAEVKVVEVRNPKTLEWELVVYDDSPEEVEICRFRVLVYGDYEAYKVPKWVKRFAKCMEERAPKSPDGGGPITLSYLVSVDTGNQLAIKPVRILGITIKTRVTPEECLKHLPKRARRKLLEVQGASVSQP